MSALKPNLVSTMSGLPGNSDLSSLLPDELLESIFKYATEFDSEFEIIHPDRHVEGDVHVPLPGEAQIRIDHEHNHDRVKNVPKQKTYGDEIEIPDPLFSNFLKSYIQFSHSENAWLKSLPTRYALCLVSKRVSRIGTPILYSSFITAQNTQRLELLYRSIVASPHLRQYIRRISLGYLGERFAEIVARVVTRCPNLIILDAEVLIDMQYVPLRVRSLRIRQSFDGFDRLTVEKKSDFIRNFLRLRQLESLELRKWRINHIYRYVVNSPGEDNDQIMEALKTSGTAGGSNFGSSTRRIAPHNPFYPSLRTVIIQTNIPLVFYYGIIHPKAPIRNAIISAEMPPPNLLLDTLSRIPHVSHAFLQIPNRNDRSSSTLTSGSISSAFSKSPVLLNLQHIDIEIFWTSPFGDGDWWHAQFLQEARSFSMSLQYVEAKTALDAINDVFKKGLAPNLRTIYTGSGYLRSYGGDRRRMEDIRELLKLIEGAGVDWVVQDIVSGTLRPMGDALAETISQVVDPNDVILE